MKDKVCKGHLEPGDLLFGVNHQHFKVMSNTLTLLLLTAQGGRTMIIQEWPEDWGQLQLTFQFLTHFQVLWESIVFLMYEYTACSGLAEFNNNIGWKILSW